MHITEGDSAMKKWLRSAWDAIQENQQRRADYWVLQNLSDRQLRDMGIGRSQIKGIIYGEESNRKAT